MSARATGGETVNKIVHLSDKQMGDVQYLIDQGFGQRELPDNAMNAILKLRNQGKQSKGERFKNWMATVSAAMRSSDPRVRREWENANASYLRTIRAASPTIGQVHTDSALSTMTTEYANDEYIGEMLAPATLVANKSDIFYTYNQADRFQQPTDDVIAEDGEAPEIVEGRGTGNYTCVDRGFKNFIAANTVANQDAPLDELFDLTAALVEHRALARERRIATLLTTAANYAAANQTTLAGATQWNSAGGGNPIADLQTGDAALFRGMAPAKTIAFSDLNVYHILSRHEDFLGLFQYSGTPIGLATPTLIATFLGWDDYLVGRARRITSVEGDADVFARIWGDFFGILRVADRQTLRSATFGMTMRWTMPGVAGANQGILSQQWFDMTKGLGGTHFAKVGESEDHIVQANDSGYIIIDPSA